MKQKLLKTLVLLCALIVGSATSWAEDEVYKTALFGASYNASNSSYTSSFDATNSGFVVTATNFNNNNNGWTSGGLGQIKCGRDGKASVATIITKSAIDRAITKVLVKIDAITTAKVNSIKLYTSSNGKTWTEAGTFSKAKGNQSVALSSPAANLYYKVEFNCASGKSNGLVTISKVEYYKEKATGTVDVTGVSLNKSSLNLEVGGNATLTATVAPADATDKVVTWESSDEDVATVEDGVVKAVGVGSATITVTTHDKGFTAICDVTVTLALKATLTFDFTDNAWNFPEDYAITNETYTNDGYTITLGASSDGHKVMTSGGKITALIWGKENATLALPAFPFNVSKIKVYGNTGASGKVTFNIFVGDEAVSDEVTGSTTNHEFKIADAKQAAGTVYTLKITNANNCQISKIEVFGYEPVTVSEVGYATYCSANALDFTGAGVKAYVGTVSNGNLTFTPVTMVPANTGLLLYKEGGATVNVPVIASADPVGTNCLTGVNEATPISSDDYILNKVGENVGFYKAGKFTSLAAHRAYITASAATKIKNFVLNFDETDGIVEIMRNGDNEKMSAIFDLSGRRVSKPTKGIYVKNGRKFIVK